MFLDFEKFKVYNEFKNFKNNLNGLFEPEPKFVNTRMRLKSLTQKSEPRIDLNRIRMCIITPTPIGNYTLQYFCQRFHVNFHIFFIL